MFLEIHRKMVDNEHVGNCLVDSDFIDLHKVGTFYIDAVIASYEKRNLNVSKNLFLYLKSLSSPMTRHIDFYKKYYPMYNKYILEVEKYLILLDK